MAFRLPRSALLVPLVFLLGVASTRVPETVNTFARIGGFTSPWQGAGGDFDGPIDDVKKMIQNSYVEEPDLSKLQDGAIKGMLESLDDPYALYVPPVDKAEFEKELMGHYAGIGAVVQIEDDRPVIATPMDGSPAVRAGLQPRDRIMEIDGESTAGLTIEDCVSKLTGAPGTEVVLTINRGAQLLKFTLRREEIIVRSVKGVSRLPADQDRWNYFLDPAARIAYVRLTQFIPTSPQELLTAFQEMGIQDRPLGGLILDLRDNPGGDLDACLDIADLFLHEGQILSIRGRDGQSQSFEAHAQPTLPPFPMVILVNGRSASASEILSGALSDHDRAIVVGSRTFGKGLVQTVRSLPHNPDAVVKFTAQRYYLPSGRLIHRNDDSKVWGVDPTPGFFVPMTDSEEIALLLKRQELEIILNGGHGAAGTVPQLWSDAAWIEDQFKDKQLAAALRAVRGYQDKQLWVTQSDAVQQPSLVSRDEFRKLEKTRERMLKSLAQLDKRMEALDVALAGGPMPERYDLWPDAMDLTGGSIRVLDKAGQEVADVAITGRDVERWLVLADIKPVRPPPTPPPPPPPAAPDTSAAVPPASGAPADPAVTAPPAPSTPPASGPN